MDWDKLKSFHAAAELGSLTAAAEWLGISQSAVSRQIAALEEGLGVSLFQRHARGLVMTDAGHTLHRSTAEMSTAAKSASSALRDQQETAQGDLIVTAPVAFGSTWLVPRMAKFLEENPHLNIDLRLDDREYDLLKLEAECAIRLWAADKADLIQRRLTTVAMSLYASPEYLAKHGTPQTPEDSTITPSFPMAMTALKCRKSTGHSGLAGTIGGHARPNCASTMFSPCLEPSQLASGSRIFQTIWPQPFRASSKS